MAARPSQGRHSDAPPRRSAFASALRRVARRDHSEHELRVALENEGQAKADIDDALARLRSSRFVDDGTFAERYTRSRATSHGQGQRRIRQSLKARGIAPELAERALRGIAQDGTEREALDLVARKYWRLHTKVEAETRMKRLWVFLLRRGFAPGLVQERLRSLWPRHGETLEDCDVAEDATSTE
jgi:regulatory protein